MGSGAHGARDGPFPRRCGHSVSTVAELTPTRPFPRRRGVKGSFVYRVVTTTGVESNCRWPQGINGASRVGPYVRKFEALASARSFPLRMREC